MSGCRLEALEKLSRERVCQAKKRRVSGQRSELVKCHGNERERRDQYFLPELLVILNFLSLEFEISDLM